MRVNLFRPENNAAEDSERGTPSVRAERVGIEPTNIIV